MSANAFNLDWSKILLFDKELSMDSLTVCQPTKFQTQQLKAKFAEDVLGIALMISVFEMDENFVRKGENAA